MRMTDAEVTAAARKMLKTTAIKDIQAELAKLDAVTMLSGEHPDFPAWIAATRSAPPSPDHTGECARE